VVGRASVVDPAVAVAPSDEQFRAELRAWLAEHPPPAVEGDGTIDDAETLREWQRTLHRGHWVGIHWPVDFGGRGAPSSQVAIYNEELARAGSPPILGRGGVTLVGPTLITHGTEEQRARWMPRILGADDIWCQLFSEPGAGSDLASLSTRAEKRGGAYRVTGQKVWSSYACFADIAIGLVRTDASSPAHKGISMLAIPMDAKGVEIRPLRQITGASDFNEVFLDDVEVPVDNLIPTRPSRMNAARRSSGRSRCCASSRSLRSPTRARATASHAIRASVRRSRSRGSRCSCSGCTTRARSSGCRAVSRSAPSRAS
jgi:alkylation response protein AidB-like acyl-CoA dehydrogenase